MNLHRQAAIIQGGGGWKTGILYPKVIAFPIPKSFHNENEISTQCNSSAVYSKRKCLFNYLQIPSTLSIFFIKRKKILGRRGRALRPPYWGRTPHHHQLWSSPPQLKILFELVSSGPPMLAPLDRLDTSVSGVCVCYSTDSLCLANWSWSQWKRHSKGIFFWCQPVHCSGGLAIANSNCSGDNSTKPKTCGGLISNVIIL